MFIGTDIALYNADIGISPTGDIDLIGGEPNIIQAAVNNMRTVLGEWFIDSSAGNAIFGKRLKNIANHMSEVEQHCRDAILYDIRIKSVKDITATYHGKYDCSVNFTVETADGNIIVSSTTINIGGGQ